MMTDIQISSAETPAFASFKEAAARQARITVAREIKTIARDYRDRPSRLEILYPGLSAANGARMIAVGQHLLEREKTMPRRHFGFGDEVPAMNAKAVILLGRAMRKAEYHQQIEQAV